MKHEKIQIVPPNSLKTKWSRAIRYGDLIFLAHREDFALMNEIFDEYFLGQGVPTTRSVTEVTFTAPKFLFEIQAVAGVKD